MSEASQVVETEEKVDFQELAEELEVNYYTNFQVVNSKEPGPLGGRLYFPIAEVYQNGSWQWIVLGGRPCGTGYEANGVLRASQAIQEGFMLAMRKFSVDSSLTNGLYGLKNPIDDWKLEPNLD